MSNVHEVLCCETGLASIDGACPFHHGDACLFCVHPEVARGLRYAVEGANKFRDALLKANDEIERLKCRIDNRNDRLRGILNDGDRDARRTP